MKKEKSYKKQLFLLAIVQGCRGEQLRDLVAAYLDYKEQGLSEFEAYKATVKKFNL